MKRENSTAAMDGYGEQQKIFYDPGVGTSSTALLAPFQFIQKMISQALGLDLHQNVEDAYRYLMNVYQDGDRIFLFGFSRGAHTVRRLASLLEKCGLLQRGSENMIPYASRMYLDQKKLVTPLSERFKRRFFTLVSRLFYRGVGYGVRRFKFIA